MEYRLTDPIDIISFLMGGNATVTLRSLKTNKHFTYRIRKPKDSNTFDSEVRFVSVLYGENTSDYQYIGMIKRGDSNGGVFCHTKGSKVSKDSASFRAFDWGWRHLIRLNVPPSLEIWHEGKCGRCGKKLTRPDSIACGLGPKCRGER